MIARALGKRWHGFWFESEVLVARLTTFRVAFFGLLGLDLWLLMVPRGQRHAFGAFNVSHVPALDGFLPRPDAAVMTAGYLLAGFLSLRVALGLATRVSLVALTVIYNALYYWSQVDSYQHHYLIGLLLLLCCFVPFERTPGIDVDASKLTSARVPSWAARLIYVQVSIVYFYTALTKVTRHWLDGWALDRIISVPWVRDAYAAAGNALGWTELGPYAFVAHVIMLWQFFVSIAFLSPRLRPLACVTGPIFHALVEVIELKIGWFSYYMIATYYILLFPDTWFLALGRPVGRLVTRLRGLYAFVTQRGARAGNACFALITAACVAAALFIPMPGHGFLAALLAIAVAWAIAAQPESVATSGIARALWHAAIALLMVGSIRLSDVPYNYYRYFGAQLRQQGQLEQAARMYEHANEHRGGRPARHLALAEIYVELKRLPDAMRAYRNELALDAGSERAHRGIERLRSMLDTRGASAPGTAP